MLQTILSPKVALWNTHKILCLLLFILWFRGVKLNRRLKKQRSRMYSAAKKPSKTDSVSLLFITKDVWGRNDSFHKKKRAYNSEILWKINFIAIFFRDCPFVFVLGWTVPGNDGFKLVFPWLFKGSVIQFLQTDFKWKCKSIFFKLKFFNLTMIKSGSQILLI